MGFTPEQFISFLGRVEKLKSVPRHCVTSDGVTENVAAHSWRTALMAYLLKDELADVMSVHGSQIGNAHILKKHPGDEQLLNPALGLLQLVRQMISVRDPVQRLFYPALEIRVYFIGTQPV